MRSLILAAALAAAASPVLAQTRPGPAPKPAGESLMSVAGDRLENVFEAADGSLYATATLGGTVLRRTKAGTVGIFLAIPNPQGLIETRRGRVLDYQDRKPDFGAPGLRLAGLGPHLIMVDVTGKIVKSFDPPDDEAFFNGLAALGKDAVLIADSGADRILKADLKTGKVEVWLDSDQTHAGETPGAPNGIKVHAGWVYFSRGDVYRIHVGKDGKPEGAVELAAQTGGTDDFDVAKDGTVYASHGSDVLKVSPLGTVETFVAGGCPSCTATRISRNGRWLYITGGPIPGRGPTFPGYMNRVAIPQERHGQKGK